jgi:hypothetical protein
MPYAMRRGIPAYFLKTSAILRISLRGISMSSYLKNHPNQFSIALQG